MQHRTSYPCRGRNKEVGQILTDNNLTSGRE